MLSGLIGATTHAYTPSSHLTKISPTCPNVSATKRVCSCPIDAHQLHCIVCKSGSCVDQRYSALARCLADLITTHTGVKDHIEQTIPGLPPCEPQPGAQLEGARMDIVFNLRGYPYHIDTAVVAPCSSNAGLISAASFHPGYMAKREEKQKFDRYFRINLAPFILETTGRPDHHAHKFIKHLSCDTNHHQQPSGTPVPLSRPHCSTASPNHSSKPSPRDSRPLSLTTTHAVSLSPSLPTAVHFRLWCLAPFLYLLDRPPPVAAVIRQ